MASNGTDVYSQKYSAQVVRLTLLLRLYYLVRAFSERDKGTP